MHIKIYNKQKNLRISAIDVKKLVHAVMTLEKQIVDEVSVNFVSTKAISKLHGDYFNDPSTTDCISFPLDDDSENLNGYRILGEVFVCPETAIQYAHKHALDPYEECTLYIVHGLLHLMGYDDLETKEKMTMRKAEKKHMLNLKKLNLILKKR